MTTPDRKVTVRRLWDDQKRESIYMVLQAVNTLRPEVDAMITPAKAQALIDDGVEVTVVVSKAMMPVGGDSE